MNILTIKNACQGLLPVLMLCTTPHLASAQTPVMPDWRNQHPQYINKYRRLRIFTGRPLLPIPRLEYSMASLILVLRLCDKTDTPRYPMLLL